MATVGLELQPGAVVGAYRVERFVGRGGMGTVYLAEHVRLQRKVALKVLAPDLAADHDFQQRFIRESQLAAALEHPSVIPIFDADEQDGVLYIAMRYVDGEDLHDILKRHGAVTPDWAAEVLEQVAGALDAAHASGFVHRDVKPANILLERGTGRVYLSDFGLARRTQSTGLTKTGSFLGSVDYCAPEQIEGGHIDGRTDVYALGGVLFHCLTGQRPYPRHTDVAVIKAHLIEAPPAVSTVRPDLPLSLDGVIATAMAKNREVRFETAGELMRAFKAALSESTMTIPATPVAAPLAPTVADAPASAKTRALRSRSGRGLSRRLKVALGAGALAILVVAGTVAFLALPGSEGADVRDSQASTLDGRLAEAIAPVATKQRLLSSQVRTAQSTPLSFSQIRRSATDLEQRL